MTEQDSVAAEDAKVAEALRFVGVRVSSVYDLLKTRQRYANAIPTLARMLREVRHPRIKEGIARALTVKEARSVAKELIEEFRAVQPGGIPAENVKWAIGNALSVAGSDDVVDEIITVIRDKSHGWSRSMLPLALANAKKKRAVAIVALLEALGDDEVACQAAGALAKLKASEAVAPLQRLTKHENKDIQRAATKALKRLEK